jgi:hypothetical protein
MQRYITLRVIRGLVYRTVWVLLYLSHLVLAVVAIIMFFGVVVVAVDKRGSASGHARRHVTVGQRCAMGILYGSLGLLSVVGARKLRQYHRQINPLYPEMQVGFHTGRATLGERLPNNPPPRSGEAMYDRDLDGGL